MEGRFRAHRSDCLGGVDQAALLVRRDAKG